LKQRQTGLEGKREREKVGMTEAEEPYVMVHALHMTGERRETHKFC